MAADLNTEDQQEMLAERRSMWQGFTKLSTYSIVGVACILIVLAIAFL